ncbi:MAG: agmatine deiminase family protein [Euryarchaeota archaeon]|nr:agmatine deiminase family protein [Euryarchaeota archaeon]
MKAFPRMLAVLCTVIMVITIFGNVSAGGGDGTQVDVFRDTYGNQHKVWREIVNGTYQMFYANNIGGNNTGVGHGGLQVTHSPVDVMYPQIAIDPVSNISYVLWLVNNNGSNELWYDGSRDFAIWTDGRYGRSASLPDGNPNIDMSAAIYKLYVTWKLDGAMTIEPDLDGDFIKDADDCDPFVYTVVGNETFSADVVVVDATLGVSIAIDYSENLTFKPIISAAVCEPLNGSIGSYVNISVSINESFIAIIKFKYIGGELPPTITEKYLRMYWFNGADWTILKNTTLREDTGVNLEHRYVWAKTSHFSTFTTADSSSVDSDKDVLTDAQEINADGAPDAVVTAFSDGTTAKNVTFGTVRNYTAYAKIPVYFAGIERANSSSIKIASGTYSFREQQMTSDPNVYHITPAIYEDSIFQDTIVWRDNRDGDDDIYLYDLTTGTETKLTNNTDPDAAPEIWGDRVVWVTTGGAQFGINLCNISSGLITNLGYGFSPDIYDNKVVWTDVSSGKVMMYNATTGQFSTICGSYCMSPRVCGDYVSYVDYTIGGLWLYRISTGQSIKINPPGTSPFVQDIDSRYVVYQDQVANDLYAYNISGGTTVRITNNTFLEDHPAIFNDTVVWADFRNVSGGDIYGYDLTNRTEFPVCIASGDQRFPAIYGNKIVWQDSRGGGYPQIYVATRATPEISMFVGTDLAFQMTAASVSVASPDFSTQINYYLKGHNDSADGVTDGYVTIPLKFSTVDTCKMFISQLNVTVYIVQTDPVDNDTDDEGLTDGEEVLQYSTNPVMANSDADGLNDKQEVRGSTINSGTPFVNWITPFLTLDNWITSGDVTVANGVLHIQSDLNTVSYAVSETIGIDNTKDYMIETKVKVLVSNYNYFHVFRFGHIWLILSGNGEIDAAGVANGNPIAQYVGTISLNEWHRLECYAHHFSSSYDVIIDGAYSGTYDYYGDTPRTTILLGDDLPNAYFGNVYWDYIKIKQGTDPNIKDSDFDGLSDGEEVVGNGNIGPNYRWHETFDTCSKADLVSEGWAITEFNGGTVSVVNGELHIESGTGTLAYMESAHNINIDFTKDYMTAMKVKLPDLVDQSFNVFRFGHIWLTLFSNGEVRAVNAMGSKTIGTLTANEWHVISCYAHTSASSYDIWIDNRYMVTSDYYGATGNNYILLGNTLQANCGKSYWDYIRLCQGTEPLNNDSDDDAISDGQETWGYSNDIGPYYRWHQTFDSSTIASLTSPALPADKRWSVETSAGGTVSIENGALHIASGPSIVADVVSPPININFAKDYMASARVAILPANYNYYHVFRFGNFWLIVAGNGEIHSITPSQTAQLVGYISMNEWHWIECYVDVVAKQYDIFIDKERMGTYSYYDLIGRSTVLIGDDLANAYYGDSYWDDIRVCQGTDLLNPDSDGDGLGDYHEIFIYRTEYLDPDTDGDNLTDGAEVQTYKTNPLNPDTDGDGLFDGDEVNALRPMRSWDFEHGSRNWWAYGSEGTRKWAMTTSTAHSGSYSWHAGWDIATYNRLYSPNLTFIGKDLHVSFYYKLSRVSPTGGVAELNLWDGSGIKHLIGYSFAAASAWTLASFNISAYEGQSGYFEFYFYSFQNGDHWYIDDVLIEAKTDPLKADTDGDYVLDGHDWGTPPEWAPKDELILTWNTDIAISDMLVNITREAITAVDRIIINIDNTFTMNHAINKLNLATPPIPFLNRVQYIEKNMASRIWVRDYGPQFLISPNSDIAVIDWLYSKGGLADDYPSFYASKPENNITVTFSENTYLDGGNFQTDGNGYGYTCSMVSGEIIKTRHGLKEIRRLDYLSSDPNLHVDMIAYIVSSNTVILPKIVESPHNDDAFSVQKARTNFLSWGFTNFYEVDTLIKSFAIFSYTNALVVNNVVLVPQYYDSNSSSPCHISQLINLDSNALQVFRNAYPGKTVVPIFIPYTVISNWGAIHCLTMTRPRAL